MITPQYHNSKLPEHVLSRIPFQISHEDPMNHSSDLSLQLSSVTYPKIICSEVCYFVKFDVLDLDVLGFRGSFK